jgi:hypothetical protein
MRQNTAHLQIRRHGRAAEDNSYSIQTYENGERPLKQGEILWALPVCYSAYVNTQEIITALDAEIARLQYARSLIAASGEPKRRGRPAKSAPSAVPAQKKRKLSPEARKKIAAAQ